MFDSLASCLAFRCSAFAQHDRGAMRTCLDANVKFVTTQLDHEVILTEVIAK